MPGDVIFEKVKGGIQVTYMINGQQAATLQNKKKLSDKEGEKLIQELHLFDTDEATVYKTQVDRVPVTAIYIKVK